MNRNSTVRFAVRRSAGSRLFHEQPIVWTGGIRQLRVWLDEKRLTRVENQQAVLGADYTDPEAHTLYYIDILEKGET
jgi:hypothetical protein